MTRFSKRVITITIVLFLYLLYGAIAFRQLEKPNEDRLCDESLYQFQKNLPLVIDGIEKYGLNYTSFNDLKNIFQFGVAAHIEVQFNPNPGISEYSIKATCPIKWSLIKSYYFSSMIVSTIGYGGNSPETPGGQLFCIFYSIAGIILFGFFLTIWSTFISKYYSYCFDCFLGRTEICKETIGVILVLVIFIVSPSVLFMQIQNWSIMEALYFCVITLSTIGFGDYVPDQVDDENSIWLSFYLTFCMLWIYFGLVCVSVLIRELTIGMGYLFEIRDEDNIVDGNLENNESVRVRPDECSNCHGLMFDPSPHHGLAVEFDNVWRIRDTFEL